MTASSPPFVDPETAELGTDQILQEAYPIAGLVLLFAGVALVPFALLVLFGFGSGLAALLTVLTQFVLAVGTAVILV
ncbi:MAG: hypothetical protein ABEJ90_05550 [Halobacterium sp.]